MRRTIFDLGKVCTRSNGLFQSYRNMFLLKCVFFFKRVTCFLFVSSFFFRSRKPEKSYFNVFSKLFRIQLTTFNISDQWNKELNDISWQQTWIWMCNIMLIDNSQQGLFKLEYNSVEENVYPTVLCHLASSGYFFDSQWTRFPCQIAFV